MAVKAEQDRQIPFCKDPRQQDDLQLAMGSNDLVTLVIIRRQLRYVNLIEHQRTLALLLRKRCQHFLQKLSLLLARIRDHAETGQPGLESGES